MRIAITLILLTWLTLPAYSIPNVRTGALPNWLVNVTPGQYRPPSAGDISHGYYYELQDQQTNLLLQTEFRHYIKQIINRSGVQDQSEVSVTFSPQYQQVVFHRIRILRDGVIIDQLQPDRIKIVQEETGAGVYEYNGLKRAFINLMDVRKGDRIDIAYSIIGFNPVFDNKYSAQLYFTRTTAVGNYFWTIISSPDRPLHFLTRNNAPAPEQQLGGNRLIYRWNNPALLAETYAPNAPSWYSTAPVVAVTEFKDWHDVVDWGLEDFQYYQYPLPAGLLAKLAEWRKAAAGNKDLLAGFATRFVQNDIRYLGLETGENSHRPHAPATVFGSRFGDCKDKALLLACILRHEGIPACAALVNTNTGQTLPKLGPSPSLFDHVIVAIQRSGDHWLYVDPTLTAQRGEITDLYIPDYGYTLLLREGEDGLRMVTGPVTLCYTMREQLDASDNDTSRLMVTGNYSGGAADRIRQLFEDNNRNEIEENFVKYYTTWLPDIGRQAPIGYADDSLANKVTVTESYAIPDLWKTDKDGRQSFDFIVKMIRDNLPDPPDDRSGAPLALNYPLQVHYTLQLNLPDEWDFGSGPLHIRNADYQFDFTPEFHGSEMTLRYDLITFADHIDAANFRQYRDDYKTIDNRVSFTLYRDGEISDPTSSLIPARTQHRRGETAINNFRPCWPAIWLSFFYALFFSRLFVWLNARSAVTRSTAGSAYSLGGWTLVLGLFIGTGFLMDGYQFFRANFYSYDNWIAWSDAGGSALQYLYVGQLAIQLNFLAGAGAILYWYLRKRDIFPSMFAWYAAIVLAGRLALIALYYNLPVPTALGAYRADLPWAFARTGVYAAIWVTYVLRSGKVKGTFLRRFPLKK